MSCWFHVSMSRSNSFSRSSRRIISMLRNVSPNSRNTTSPSSTVSIVGASPNTMSSPSSSAHAGKPSAVPRPSPPSPSTESSCRASAPPADPSVPPASPACTGPPGMLRVPPSTLPSSPCTNLFPTMGESSCNGSGCATSWRIPIRLGVATWSFCRFSISAKWLNSSSSSSTGRSRHPSMLHVVDSSLDALYTIIMSTSCSAKPSFLAARSRSVRAVVEGNSMNVFTRWFLIRRDVEVWSVDHTRRMI
mmetsp:Transcript_3746/g.10291  ORF Transcript_3746/g.10291 Transcript_3746/m.10291 type:complete len:248 (-) Transcript_3746:1915-2658(-)